MNTLGVCRAWHVSLQTVDQADVNARYSTVQTKQQTALDGLWFVVEIGIWPAPAQHLLSDERVSFAFAFRCTDGRYIVSILLASRDRNCTVLGMKNGLENFGSVRAAQWEVQRAGSAARYGGGVVADSSAHRNQVDLESLLCYQVRAAIAAHGAQTQGI